MELEIREEDWKEKDLATGYVDYEYMLEEENENEN